MKTSTKQIKTMASVLMSITNASSIKEMLQVVTPEMVKNVQEEWELDVTLDDVRTYKGSFSSKKKSPHWSLTLWSPIHDNAD